MAVAEVNKKMARLAYAFSDPLRIQILSVLRQAGDVCNCEFQSKLGMSQSKASYHLKILMDEGLIKREIRGTWSYYSIVDNKTVERLWKALETK
jgi:ArsR family transcriptional regulator